jgi:hypothetical protein
MRTGLLLIVLILAVALAPAQAQTARAIAVVDFADTGLDSGWVPQAMLSDILRQLLERRLPAPTQVIAGDRVRAAMRARGYTHEDLIYPSRAALIAQDVGADWVVTGTWKHLRVISRGDRGDPPFVRQGDASAIADVEVRVLEASSRRRLLEERFYGRAPGGDLGSLIIAATEALRDAAGRIAQLQL